MIRTSASVSLFVLFLMIYTVFQVEQHVQSVRTDLIETNRQLNGNIYQVHLLKAEWAYLTKPTRLEEMVDKYLNTDVISVSQVGNVKSIPLKTRLIAQNKN